MNEMSKTFRYDDDASAPKGYKCSVCGKTGEKLWRQTGVLASQVDLLCLTCAEEDQKNSEDANDRGWRAFSSGRGDEIGDLVPAIPVPGESTYWGRSSTPSRALAWWWARPPRADAALAAQLRVQAVTEETDKAARRQADDDEQARNIRETVYIVEATSFEKSCLWERWAFNNRYSRVFPDPKNPENAHRVHWADISLGFWKQLGELAGSPVCVSVFFARILGKTIAFYEGSSQVVDMRMVEAWLDEEFPNARGRVNAQNFHNCVGDLERMLKDEEKRQ